MSIFISIGIILASIVSIATSSIGIDAYRTCTSHDLIKDKTSNVWYMSINIFLSVVIIGLCVWGFRKGRGVPPNKFMLYAIAIASILSIATSSIAIQAYNKCTSPDLKKEKPKQYLYLHINLGISIGILCLCGFVWFRRRWKNNISRYGKGGLKRNKEDETTLIPKRD